MEGKLKVSLFVLMGGLFRRSTVVIFVVIFGGWVQRMGGQLPQI